MNRFSRKKKIILGSLTVLGSFGAIGGVGTFIRLNTN